MSLKSRIEEFVQDQLPRNPSRVRDRKVIHDSVWGSNIFYKHEMAVIDTPLMQRLRQISQTGLAFYTYPSATHSRFEHSLGVTVMAARYARNLNDRDPATLLVNGTPEIGDLAEVRMAALLHDVGHALFSHASEEVYKWRPEIREILGTEEFANANAQEVLSHLIVTSKAFAGWFEENVLKPYPCQIDLANVAAMITGRHPVADKSYIAEIINGPFDADKMDYLARDGLFCGLHLPSDIDRLFHTVSTHVFPDGKRRLVVESAVPVEQILFSKMMLHATIYHHHKVRAAECQLRGIVELLFNEDVTINGKECADAVDLLRLTDSDVLTIYRPQENEIVDKLIGDISSRRLLKRAAVISKQSVDGFEAGSTFLLTRIPKMHPSELLGLRQRILDRLPAENRCNIHELWVDFPSLPTLSEASQTHIMVAGEPIQVTRLFPLEGWLKAYGIYRWRAHVFCPPGLQRDVFEATRAELASLDPPIRLNDLAWRLAHVPEEIT